MFLFQIELILNNLSTVLKLLILILFIILVVFMLYIETTPNELLEIALQHIKESKWAQ